MEFDVLIRGGLLVDGTGSPAMPGDLGIVGDRIAAVGRLEGATGGVVLEAGGKVIAPGFIDPHSHAELARLGGVDQFCGIEQGVTTELLSPDGFSWAPLSPARMQEVRDFLHVFYGDPGLSWDWRTVDEYLSLFRGRVPGNLVPQVPHLSIKVEAMGWENRPATDAELGYMKRMTREWLDAGAVALAVGLEYQPTSSSPLSELVELSKLVAERGGIYVTHQRGYWYRLERGTRESLRIGKEAGIPVHISHLAVEERTAALLSDGLAAGVDLSFDLYPYAAACTHLMMMLPEWAQAGGYAAVMARLADPGERARMREETAHRVAERGEIVLAGVENGAELEGRLLGDLAREAGMADVDYLFDLLRTHGGRVLALYHWEARLDREGIVRRSLSHPLYVACTDGIFAGTRPHPRGFGSFPRLVGKYVRDGTLTLEQAVRKVSGYTAERLRVPERGLLRPGLAADVVVFDAATVVDRATFGNGRQAPEGIDHVLVGGQLALTNGRPTGVLAGRVVKGLG